MPIWKQTTHRRLLFRGHISEEEVLCHLKMIKVIAWADYVVTDQQTTSNRGIIAYYRETK